MVGLRPVSLVSMRRKSEIKWGSLSLVIAIALALSVRADAQVASQARPATLAGKSSSLFNNEKKTVTVPKPASSIPKSLPKPQKRNRVQNDRAQLASSSAVRVQPLAIQAGVGQITAHLQLGAPSVQQSTKGSLVKWPNLVMGNLPSGVTLLDDSIAGNTLTISFAVPGDAKNFQVALHGKREKVFTSASSSTNAEGNLTIGPARQFRSLRFVTVSIPISTTTASRVKALEQADLTLSFLTTSTAQKSSEKDPLFDGAYTKMVVNASDIAVVRTPLHVRPVTSVKGKSPQSGSFSVFESQRVSWINPAAPYIKLSVVRDGVYRITVAQLQSFTKLDISNWITDSIRLFNRGVEVPVWIETASDGKPAAIEFYGEHLKGDQNEFYNVATDTNAYWLTNTTTFSGAAKRYTVGSQQGGSTIAGATITLHHERDFFYYGGDALIDESATLHRTPWIDGERFVWNILNRPNGTDTSAVRDTFYLASLPVAGSEPKIRFLLRGISHDPSITPTPHHYRVRINGATVADNTFNDFDVEQRELPVTPSILRNGANTVEIQSSGSDATIDQFYVDHYEIVAQTPLAPSIDTAIARGQLHFTLAGGTSGALNIGTPTVLYDLAQAVRYNGTSANVTVSGSGEGEFVGSTTGAMLLPARTESWNVGEARRGWELLAKSNNADYIALSNPIFISGGDQPAMRLQLDRQSRGLRTMLVSTDEVFNTFNYGSNEPLGIRHFLKYAYENYSGSPIGFVTLFGDGNWDPKFNLNNSLRRQEDRTIHPTLVPTFGVPASDYIYTVVEQNDADTVSPQLVISRIPVETLTEASQYLTKLFEYESTPPADWNKRFLFIVGGNSGFEHGEFDGDVTYYNQLPGWGAIAKPPMNIHSTVIDRTDFSSGVDASHVADIQSAFRSGQAIVYFSGHGATNITDVSFGSPTDYHNKGLYPVLITLSCRTGAFAEPNLITLNEAFLRTAEAGAVMTYGTTGFGETVYDRTMSAHLFELMHADTSFGRLSSSNTELAMSVLFTASKVYASSLSPAGLAYANDNARYQYSVLGDAAMGFCLRPHPELGVLPQESSITNRFGDPRTSLNVNDSFYTVTTTVHNYGFSLSVPLHVRMVDEGPGGVNIAFTDTINRLDSAAMISVRFPLEQFMVGSHLLRITADYDNQYAEANENDNEVTLSFLVSGSRTKQLLPFDATVGTCDLSGDSVHFVFLGDPTDSSLQAVDIELDTTSAFTHTISLPSIAASSLQTLQLSVSRTRLPVSSGRIIWWRWREHRKDGTTGDWQTASFSNDTRAASGLLYTTNDQFVPAIYSGLVTDKKNGLTLSLTDTVHFDIISRSLLDTTANDNPVSQVLLNERSVLVVSEIAGMGLAVLTSDGGGLEYGHVFSAPKDAYDSASQARLAHEFDSVVKLVPDSRRVILITNGQPFMDRFHKDPVAVNALHAIGATGKYTDSLNFFGKYILWGVKNGGGAEEYVAGSETKDKLEIRKDTVIASSVGTARTTFTAKAARFHKLQWVAEGVTAGDDIYFRVLGIKKASNEIDTVARGYASALQEIDLSGIDPNKYNKLAVEVRLMRNPSVPTSPLLREIYLTYDPAPEFVVNAIGVDHAIVDEGGTVITTYSVQNLTCYPAQNITATLDESGAIGTRNLSNHLIPTLGGNASVSLKDTVQTSGLLGEITLTATVNPNEVVNEQEPYNNSLATSFKIARDTIRPVIEVLFDDRQVPDCEYVDSKSLITIRMNDNGLLRQTDSSSIFAFLRNDSKAQDLVVLTSANGDPNYDVRFVPFTHGGTQAELQIQPKTPLTVGKYTLTAIAKDASGNVGDTIKQCFEVSGANGVEHVMNYPNPFDNRGTDFTFVMRSGGSTKAKVAIYTIAGRKIKTLETTDVHAGLNNIHWDGRDESGNAIANGTYLYKVVIDGQNPDGTDMNAAIMERAVKSQ